MAIRSLIACLLLFAGVANAGPFGGESHGALCIGSSCDNTAPPAPDTTAGRVLLIDTFVSSSGAARTLSTPAGWTRIDPTTLDSNTVFNERVFCKVAVGSDSMPVLDWTGSGNTVYMQASSYSGPTAPNCSTMVHASSAGQTTSGFFLSQSLTITHNNTLVHEVGAKLQSGTPVDYVTINCPSDVNGGQFANDHQMIAFWPQVAGCFVIQTTASSVSSANHFMPTNEEATSQFSVALSLDEQDTSTPTFSSNPVGSAVSNTVLRATLTANTSPANTVKCGAWPIRTGTPTAAQVAAGTGAHGTNSAAATGSSQTIDITVTDSPSAPAYRPFCVLDAGSSNFSIVPNSSDTCLTPPAGFQYVNCPTGLTNVTDPGSVPKAFNDKAFKVISYGGQTANFHVGDVLNDSNGAWGFILLDNDLGSSGTLTVDVRSGTFGSANLITDQQGGSATENAVTTTYAAIASGDFLQAPTTLSPSGAALTVGPTGQYSFTASGVQSGLNGLIYDVSALAYFSLDVDFWANNAPPFCSAQRTLVLTTGVAMTPISLASLCGDTDNQALTYGRIAGTLPTGLSFASSTGLISGTPTVENEAGVTVSFVAIDPANTTAQQDLLIYPITTWTLTDCTTTVTDVSSCANMISALSHQTITTTITYACNALLPVGAVVSQSPVAGSQVAPGAAVALIASLGNCLTTIPNCLGFLLSQCRTIVAMTSVLASVNAQTGCTVETKTVYSQGPAVGEAANTNFVLTVFCR